jgi:hypothetical protein
MVHPGFESDASFFEIVAGRAKNPGDREELLKVAVTYRELAQTEQPLPFGCSRADFWSKRAEKCRTLADTFKSTACRDQLRRLAETYEYMASLRD